MAVCEYTEGCIFFVEEVGFSPELNRSMRERYCLGDNSECARLRAMEFLALDLIPDDLLPSDLERLERLIAESRASG